MKHARGYALKSVAFLLAPFVFGMLVATVQGWKNLSANPRMLAGWLLLLVATVTSCVFLFRAARAAMGHETPAADRRAWRTGVLALSLAVIALFLVPWRELGDWLAATLSEVTGIPILSPGRTR